MKSRKSIANKIACFYKKVEEKRKGQKTRLQTDQEFKQKKIFELNKKYNADMFSTLVRGGKSFAAEQKLRELKKRIFRLKALEKKISKRVNPYQIIRKLVGNMKSQPTTKYKQVPNDTEKNTLSSEASRERFNFPRLEKISIEKNRIEKFDKKIYQRKKLKLRSPLEVGEEVLILAVRIKKKNSLGKFCKGGVDNKSYFHKQETFLITDR